jgi:two-component SAPR family response regulator
MGSLADIRVLIVEDEAMLVLELQDLLAEFGCSVVGKAARLADAVQLASMADCDIVILDINLGGERVDPVADILHNRGIPFIFATGYGGEGLNAEYRSVPLVEKPYDSETLRAALVRTLFKEVNS